MPHRQDRFTLARWRTVSGVVMAACAATAAAALLVVACDSGITEPPYDPGIDASAFVTTVSNVWFPLVPGTTHTFEAQTPDGRERIVVEILASTRVVNGVAARIVHDQVFLNGSLIEDTFDWYAEDRDGNIWYLGEDSKEIENGRVVSTEGSWEWGKDGALPGIYMWADPALHIGESYRQEYYRGEAEDWAKVVAVGQSVTVPFGSFTGCIQTEDWNALEQGGREFKYYCRQLGVALEVEVSSGGRVELVDVSRR